MSGMIYRASSPSNIALIKYWGKQDTAQQWPANDSLSMTLKHARTTTSVRRLAPGSRNVVRFGSVTLNAKDPIAKRTLTHLETIRKQLGVQGALAVDTENSFPTSCGIASSASGMAALTVAACGAFLQCDSIEALEAAGLDRSQLANLARQGSGSAARSLHGGFVRWLKGTTPQEQHVTRKFGPEHWPLADVVVLVSDQPKGLSSSEAHQLAWTSPLFSVRLSGLEERLRLVERALAARDIAALGPLIEMDALEMHSVILTGSQPHCYLSPKSIDVINWLRRQRIEHGLQAYFTIDAGPNIHILCEPQVQPQLLEALKDGFGDTKLLVDETGTGSLLETLES